MRLFLVRHGAVIPAQKGKFYGGTEVPLSPKGENQAQAAGRWLAQFKVDALYSSPLKRALFGARAVQAEATAKDLTIRQLDSFREIDRGRWVGLRYDELESKFPQDMTNHLADLENWNGHGGESLGQLRTRVLNARDSLRDSHQNQVVVVVSHLFPTVAILADAMGMPLSEYSELQIPTGSVTQIDYSSTGASVRLVGHEPSSL
ncbi:MAG: histidine phosphatase family protein [Planctomycetota bacterium]|jgi:broad specificity phosphatase PhoE|nr:histidine phosphatase family protein [Planctomycetota bacterium]